MIKGYKNMDPGTIRQKAIPVSVYREMAKDNTTEKAAATGQLLVGAFFFAMRSCEYLETSKDRRTQRLKLGNLRFTKRNKKISHDSSSLSESDCITIKFEIQKNDKHDVYITMHHIWDLVMCPVRSWAKVSRLVLSYSGSDDSTPVNTYFDEDKKIITLLPASEMLSAIRTTVTRMGVDTLGFTASECGTHSNRSGSAMAMYLAGVPVFTIMLIGHWSSDAFLLYIRSQVQSFSTGVSQRMVTTSEFYTIPNFVSHEDPLTTNDKNKSSGRGLIGLSATSRSHRNPFGIH